MIHARTLIAVFWDWPLQSGRRAPEHRDAPFSHFSAAVSLDSAMGAFDKLWSNDVTCHSTTSGMSRYQLMGGHCHTG